MPNLVERLQAKYGAKNIVIGVLILLLIVAIGWQFLGGAGLTRFNYEGGVVGVAPSVPGEKAYDRATGGALNYGRPENSSLPPIYPSPNPSTPNNPTADRKVIRNGSLDLLVKNAEQSVALIQGIAAAHKGFVEGSNIYEVSQGVKAGTVTIRVPATDFEAAMEEIKKLAVKVQRENTNSQDVTAQFVDLEAQLKNYKAEEEQYRQIMARAVRIEDVLNVAQRLAEVRGRIEQVQGQLNYLSRQVDMSTISISLTSEAEVQVFGIVWRPLTVIKQAFKQLLEELTRFVNALIYFIFGLPALILWIAAYALLIWIVWKIGKWIYRRFFSDN